MVSEYLAHTLPDSDRVEYLADHLMKTAELAEQFAAPFHGEAVAKQTAMLHDIGKYGNSYQKRIRGANLQVDHSTAGALEANKLKNIPAAFCIAGHHAGLPDLGTRVDVSKTLYARLKSIPGRDIDNYDDYRKEIQIPPAETPRCFVSDFLTAFFYTHMLYSCLVDADWLDTEAFMSNGQVQREIGEPLDALSQKLDTYVEPWWNPSKEINRRRCQILRHLLDVGTDKQTKKGIYTLTVPTGGGKTVSSMAFALRHALTQGCRRIIYIIPYTSIIEQTYAIFEQIFGEENVVAHYANISYPTDENGKLSDVDKKRILATENWDAPIILTTAVQFFESLFSNRSSSCRKLHNIADSVLIFDEAQMIPADTLRPCIWSITELVKNYGCTAVLCTATQPALGPVIKEWFPEGTRELCFDVEENYQFFQRVTYCREGKLSDEAVAQRLLAESQVLCVVNRRDQAQAIFRLLPEDGAFHLSTTMTPQHRTCVLNEIRRRLRERKTCRVVSTSLIEAGVDVDFPSVYRAIAGLDSIIQAGGRCNREGKRARDESVVHLFETEKRAPRGLEQNIDAAQRTMEHYADISSPEAVEAYFRFLFYTLRQDEQKDVHGTLKMAQKLNFASVSKSFHIIDDASYTLYIPSKESKDLIQELREKGINRSLMRKLGMFSVSVAPYIFTKYQQLGVVEMISENAGILSNPGLYYDSSTGLSLDPTGGYGIFS